MEATALGFFAEHAGRLGLLLGATILSIVLSIGATVLVALHLPADFFLHEKRPLPLAGRPMWLRLVAGAAKNLLGLALVVVGLLMSLPGVPGQGLLTILLGVMLLDFPGKHHVERALVRRRFVHTALNKLRVRFDRPPILLPET